MNTWVLLRELPELESGAKGPDAAALAVELQKHFVYPVDSLIFTPEVMYLQHLPMKVFLRQYRLPRERRSRYFTWLKSALNNR